jgi:(E)-4-hydroxy-3-methylbut-2-enyl-diphosphate synthase
LKEQMLDPRRRTRRVLYGDVAVGGGAPVSIQSMCTCPAYRKEEAIKEIAALARAGCQIVRVAVKSDGDVLALPSICGESSIPVVADVHFDADLAVRSAGAGVEGLRINPGNIGGEKEVRTVIEAADSAGIPVRVGVNSGSMERDLRSLHDSDPARALFTSARRHLDMLERIGFEKIVFSLKSSNPSVTVSANMLFAEDNDYPLHIGVTEAGPPLSGAAKSAVAMTMLLERGIGDTLRISLSGDPVNEVIAAAALLSALGLRDDFPDIVSCPTCGRCQIDVASIAGRLERELLGVGKRFRIAVMGCEVNGPGEARDADIGLAGAAGGAVLFMKGKVVRRLGGDFTEEFIAEVLRAVREG